MLIAKDSTLLFIGDSITDCARSQPAGEGLFDALGKGYVAMVDALLAVQYPQRPIRVINQGSSGNTVRDLKRRWTTDVLDKKPDWLCVMIGINDVWRQFDSPYRKAEHVPKDEYAATLADLTRQAAATTKNIVLMTPFFIEPNRTDAMRAMIDQYGAAVKAIAAENTAIFVDTQAAFDKFLTYRHASFLAWDRVHPSPTGHMLIAKAFLTAVGYGWSA